MKNIRETNVNVHFVRPAAGATTGVAVRRDASQENKSSRAAQNLGCSS